MVVVITGLENFAKNVLMDFTTKTAVAHVAFAEMMKCVIKSLGTVSMAVNQTIRIRFVKTVYLDSLENIVNKYVEIAKLV